ncbi:MAG TPA: aspartate aminotransferase family protein, partial [Stellaceae bacterium]|nr:aspartate aminotransferase family protein [Stellaceae bacterium]
MTNDLTAFWMPFTSNRQFKQDPRLLVSADGMYYRSHDGREILDGSAALWCVNAGHNRRPIVEAIRKAAGELDFAPTFQFGHPAVFELASSVSRMTQGQFPQVFFCNSGSEAVDSALKIALAWHRVRGEGQRTRLIGRERAYHGVGFGGISVGGMVANRRTFGTMLAGVDHLRHTYDPHRNRFSRGLPQHGVELAEDLERIVALHDASTIAAVIIEPVAGSTGVLLPAPGYLERIRAICDRYGILLIFDEVITGFGRLGTPFAFDRFGVKPDLVTVAKGLTNGAVPMGAVLAREGIYETFLDAAQPGAIELFHGYTYTGHPLACAAGIATLDLYREEGLFERAAGLESYWEDALHSLRDARHVTDLRNLGLIGAVEIEPRPGTATTRAFDVFVKAYELGLLTR